MFSAGTKFGPYDILSPLGACGLGERFVRPRGFGKHLIADAQSWPARPEILGRSYEAIRAGFRTGAVHDGPRFRGESQTALRTSDQSLIMRSIFSVAARRHYTESACNWSAAAPVH